MPYISRPPEPIGDQVYFNDRVFAFRSPLEAAVAAKKLAACNEAGSLWELVDLTSRLEAATIRSADEGRN